MLNFSKELPAVHTKSVKVDSTLLHSNVLIYANLCSIADMTVFLNDFLGGSTQQRFPSYFREITGNSPDRKAKSFQGDAKKMPQLFFPPASSRENEYHIMKFYSITSTLVNAVLNDSNVKVDFPFRVTELEHAIINLQTKPPSSLLLLGRSGTGEQMNLEII